MSLTKPQMQAFLSGLETEAAEYGMQLNEEKTELVSSDTRPQSIYFTSGKKVSVVTQAKYLGSLISWDKPFEAAFFHRLGIAQSAYKKMR